MHRRFRCRSTRRPRRSMRDRPPRSRACSTNRRLRDGAPRGCRPSRARRHARPGRERSYRLAGKLLVARLADERKHAVAPRGHKDGRGHHVRTLLRRGAQVKSKRPHPFSPSLALPTSWIGSLSLRSSVRQDDVEERGSRTGRHRPGRRVNRQVTMPRASRDGRFGATGLVCRGARRETTSVKCMCCGIEVGVPGSVGTVRVLNRLDGLKELTPKRRHHERVSDARDARRNALDVPRVWSNR